MSVVVQTNDGSAEVPTKAEFDALPTGMDGAVHAITHSSAEALALDFSLSDVGFKVTASANITDITISNGAASGNAKRRIVQITASGGTVTIASTTALLDADAPSSLADTETVLLDVVDVA